MSRGNSVRIELAMVDFLFASAPTSERLPTMNYPHCSMKADHSITKTFRLLARRLTTLMKRTSGVSFADLKVAHSTKPKRKVIRPLRSSNDIYYSRRKVQAI